MHLAEIISKIKKVIMDYLANGAGKKYSDVARVHSDLGQETFLRSPYPLQQKTTEFEVKNRCKREEEIKEENLL